MEMRVSIGNASSNFLCTLLFLSTHRSHEPILASSSYPNRVGGLHVWMPRRSSIIICCHSSFLTGLLHVEPWGMGPFSIDPDAEPYLRGSHARRSRSVIDVPKESTYAASLHSCQPSCLALCDSWYQTRPRGFPVRQATSSPDT